MRKSILAFAFLAVLGVPLASTASTISGVLSVTGTIEISNDSIAFGSNQFSVTSPASSQQGGFTALAGTTGNIGNITNPPYATGVIFPTPDFMTFAIVPNITFTLLELEPGTAGAAGCTSTPPAAGQMCTPSLPSQSPFNLFNLSATSSIATFSILGVEVDSLTDTSTPVTGVFTVPLAGENFQTILATIAGGGTVSSSFAAQFTTDTSSVPPVPEPGTLSMMAIGMLAIGMLELVWFRRTRNTARISTAI
jgi:hypothetical protein